MRDANALAVSDLGSLAFRLPVYRRLKPVTQGLAVAASSRRAAAVTSAMSVGITDALYRIRECARPRVRRWEPISEAFRLTCSRESDGLTVERSAQYTVQGRK